MSRLIDTLSCLRAKTGQTMSKAHAAFPELISHAPSFTLPLASDDDRALCRALIRGGSKTFSAASLLLPAKIREPAFALYAFCRLSDDLVDVNGGSHDAIARLRQRLDQAYAGRPADAGVDRAFADVVAGFEIPRALPEALIDGLEWDVDGVVCEELTDLLAYAARVAGAVGAMMSVIMGVRDRIPVARACDLGVAMQLTNVARDIGEDARAGRLYLPRAWLRDEGIDPERWLAHPVCNPTVAGMVARLLEIAESLYRRADAGIDRLPVTCRPGIYAARHLYREIGAEVARRGHDSISGRARVSGARKISLLGQSLADAMLARSEEDRDVPPLAETAYLVEAVVSQSARRESAARRTPQRMTERVVWAAELFATLDARNGVSG
jgi:phytoene synthase